MHKNKNLHTAALAVFSFIVLGGAILPAVVGASPSAGVPDLYVLFPNRRHPTDTTTVVTGTISSVSVGGSTLIMQSDDTQQSYGVDFSDAKLPTGLGLNLNADASLLAQGDHITVQGTVDNQNVITASVVSDVSMIKRGFQSGKVVRIDPQNGMMLVNAGDGTIYLVDISSAAAAVNVKGKSGPMPISKIQVGDIVMIFGRTAAIKDINQAIQFADLQRKLTYANQVAASAKIDATNIFKAVNPTEFKRLFAGDPDKTNYIYARYVVNTSVNAIQYISPEIVGRNGQYKCFGVDCQNYLDQISTTKAQEIPILSQPK